MFDAASLEIGRGGIGPWGPFAVRPQFPANCMAAAHMGNGDPSLAAPADVLWSSSRLGQLARIYDIRKRVRIGVLPAALVLYNKTEMLNVITFTPQIPE